MRVKIFNRGFNGVASLLSGVLLFWAFPKYDLWWLAWIGFLPLLIVLHRESCKRSFWWSYLCGIVFFAGIFNWVLEVPGYKFYHHAILIPYLGLYFGIFGWLISYLNKHWNPAAAFLSAPFLWVALEFLRSNLSFLALPWALLAHSQYQSPTTIQIASVTGAYGVSFLIMAVNSAVCAVVLPLLISAADTQITYYRLPSKRFRAVLFCTVVLFVTGTLVFGHLSISNQNTERHIKVAVVQGNIDREKKRHLKKNGQHIMQRHELLTMKAAADTPELIVWPEAATPGFLLKNKSLMRQMTTIIRQADTHFLIGSSEYAKFAGNPKDRSKTGNTALYFSPAGKILDQYLKIQLVPFGEYLPYQNIIPWPEFIAPSQTYFEVPGKDFTLFELDSNRFGVIICWEIVFPGLFRTFVKNGANFMLNITNEGWFGATALNQMVSISVFRAVENRVSLARAANTGISCFIDPFGRITGRVTNGGQDKFVDGFLTREIELSNTLTCYTLYGDFFAYLCILISALSVFAALVKGKRG